MPASHALYDLEKVVLLPDILLTLEIIIFASMNVSKRVKRPIVILNLTGLIIIQLLGMS